MSTKVKVLLFILLILTALPYSAQTTPLGTDCDYAPMIETLRLTSASLDKGGNPFQALQQLQIEVELFKAECLGLTFSSELEGLQAVIGPVEIPAGVYKAIATTEAAMIVQVDLVDGECEGRGFGSLFNLTGGQGADGAEALFMSEGCTVLISISNTREPWTLVREDVIPRILVLF